MAKPNGKTGGDVAGGKASSSKIWISLDEPRPLLDEGDYLAVCTDATVAWSRRWKKWIVRLVMQPNNYTGQPYCGHLCKFLSLGQNPIKPHAGQQSQFRKLWVEVNGAQPVSGEVSLDIFVGHHFEVKVRTVRADRNGNEIATAHHYSVVREILFCAVSKKAKSVNKLHTSNIHRDGSDPTNGLLPDSHRSAHPTTARVQ